METKEHILLGELRGLERLFLLFILNLLVYIELLSSWATCQEALFYRIWLGSVLDYAITLLVSSILIQLIQVIEKARARLWVDKVRLRVLKWVIIFLLTLFRHLAQSGFLLFFALILVLHTNKVERVHHVEFCLVFRTRYYCEGLAFLIIITLIVFLAVSLRHNLL